MVRRTGLTPFILVLAIVVFAASAYFRNHARESSVGSKQSVELATAVVLPPALQVVVYVGDTYLAAVIETIRAVTSLGTGRPDEALFRLRAHEAVSRLNPCHEDNYWIGNAELTWGGSQELGLKLLKRAMDCRDWDQWPAFFYAFNQQFFYRNVPEAARALEIAAKRADEKNATAFRRLAIMLQAGQFADARSALVYVERERERTTDPRLREMLGQRAIRLQGLVTLRDAKQAFEQKMGRSLVDPGELVNAGILEAIPVDPLDIGYALEQGEFQLRRRTNVGLESLR
jgi:hypothetical protein